MALGSNAHIDPQLFKPFVSKGVYREYAQRFVDQEQIDTVETQVLKLGRR